MTIIKKKAAMLLSGTGSNAQAILEYLKNTDLEGYRALIEKLNIRK
jgi:ribosomal protein S15P/S13E